MKRRRADILEDDPAFTARIRARDPEALESVVRTTLAQVHRIARSAGLGPQQAEDVAQATFLTFIESAPTFEGRSQVRTWLLGILYNKIAEARRGASREAQHDPIDEVVESRFNVDGTWARPPRPLDLHLEDKEIRKGIQDCLGELPIQQKMAFLLREAQGLSTQEICKILDVTVTHLGVLFFRSRNRLRECLEQKGLKGSRS